MKTFRYVRFSILTVAFASAGLASAEPHPVAPQLSSLPSATYTIYLDFSGFSYPGIWDGKMPRTVPAYSTTSSTVSFSAADQIPIGKMWAYTAQKTMASTST